MLQPLYGGALARPFVTHHNALDRDLFLRIADRAVPQAADRRRARARVRDRQGLPQRGRVLQAQPRVHDARVVRGVRGLQRHRGPARGAGRVRRAARSATTARSTSRGRGSGSRSRDAIREETGIDMLDARRDALPRRRGTARAKRVGHAAVASTCRAGPPEPHASSWTTRRSCRRSRRTTAPRTGSSSASRRSPAGWSSPTRSPS